MRLLAPEPVPARPSTCARRSSSSILVIPNANASRSSEPNPSASHSFLKTNEKTFNRRLYTRKKREKHSPDIPKALRFETRLEPYPAHDTRIKSRVRRQFCRRRSVHVRIYGLIQVHRQPAPSCVLALRGDRYGRRRRRRRRRWWWWFSPHIVLMRADVRDEECVVARTWGRRFRARFG